MGSEGRLGLNGWEHLQQAQNLLTCGNEDNHQDFGETLGYREPASW